MRFYVEQVIEGWTWFARNPAKDGPVVMVGPDYFESEKAARSSVAKARKAAQGAKMASVVTLGEDD